MSSPDKLAGLFVLRAENLDLIYSSRTQGAIARLVDIVGPPQTRESVRLRPDLLAGTEVIFSGWGGPVLDAEFLAMAPRLRAVFYGAGSVRPLTPPAFWERGIRITSAYAANAVPVAEYALSTILLSLKHFWKYAAETKAGRPWGDHTRPVPGAFGRVVGLVSFGMIARRLANLLRAFDVRCVVYCPFTAPADAEALGVELVSLEEVFRRSDVVSLHTPVLPETVGLVTGELLASMKPGASLVNTARGPIIRQRELVDVFRRRPDLTAVLDVTDPEPPAADDPIFTLPNVIVTPHLAGSHAQECQRMGAYMLEELERYLANEPLRWEVTKEQVEKMA